MVSDINDDIKKDIVKPISPFEQLKQKKAQKLKQKKAQKKAQEEDNKDKKRQDKNPDDSKLINSSSSNKIKPDRQRSVVSPIRKNVSRGR